MEVWLWLAGIGAVFAGLGFAWRSWWALVVPVGLALVLLLVVVVGSLPLDGYRYDADDPEEGVGEAAFLVLWAVLVLVAAVVAAALTAAGVVLGRRRRSRLRDR